MEVSCSLCDGDGVRELFRRDAIPYYRCLGCGFVFSRPDRNANFETDFADYEPAYGRYLEGSPDAQPNFDALLAWASEFRPGRAIMCSISLRRTGRNSRLASSWGRRIGKWPTSTCRTGRLPG